MEEKICIVCQNLFIPKDKKQPRKEGHGLCCGRRCGGKWGRRNNHREPIERFLEKILIGNDCWIYRGKKSGEHCQFHLRKENDKRIIIGAHIFSYEIFVGPVPEGRLVCHHCDNPPCVRPSHLFIGTTQDNALDAKAKGRLDIRRGERNTRARWTEDKIKMLRELYAQGISRRELRLRFPEIPYGTLDGFIYDQSWKHLL